MPYVFKVRKRVDFRLVPDKYFDATHCLACLRPLREASPEK